MELARHPRGQEEHRAEWTATLHQSSSGPCRQGDDRASIGTVGDSYDNALAETINGLYKTELIKPRKPWRTVEQVELATAEWVDWFNTRRLHSSLGYLSPAAYEAKIHHHQAADAA